MEKDNLEYEKAVIRLLLDPNIRHACGNNIHPWFFGLPINRRLVKAICDESLTGIHPESMIIKTLLQSDGVIDVGDERHIDDIYSKYQAIQNGNYDAVVKLLNDFINKRKADKVIHKYADDKDINSFLSAMGDINSNHISRNIYLDFEDEQAVQEAISKDFVGGESPILSSIRLINTLSLYGGYKKGDLGLIVAPPKVGKTTFLVQEGVSALNQNLKVAHHLLGDNTYYDGLIKYMACLTNLSMAKDIIPNFDNLLEHYTSTVFHNNLRLAAVPSGKLTVDEIVGKVGYLKETGFDPDLVIIDYDLNIKQRAKIDGATMYEAGGEIYSALKRMAEEFGCAVLIGSQPGKSYWLKEKLDQECAAESSKKQHHVDFMFTMGRNEYCPHVGIFNIPLIRRRRNEDEEGRKIGTYTYISYEMDKSKILEIDKVPYRDIVDKYKANEKSIEEGYIPDEE